MTWQNEFCGLWAATNADSEPMVKSSMLLENVQGESVVGKLLLE